MASNSALPEEQDKVMEKYIADDFPMVHVRSSQEMGSLIAHIENKAKSSHPWKNLKQSIETALYSTAMFSLGITFETTMTADGRS
jgi:hypothetical protein